MGRERSGILSRPDRLIYFGIAKRKFSRKRTSRTKSKPTEVGAKRKFTRPDHPQGEPDPSTKKTPCTKEEGATMRNPPN